jgi:hypothetical protein
MSKDPLTFKHIANGTPLPTTAPVSFGEDGSFNAEVHSTGEIWATMLWECYAALLRDPRYTFVAAQERMKRYLVASLKLTPVDPTLLEARDAVLAAAIAVDEQDYRLFCRHLLVGVPTPCEGESERRDTQPEPDIPHRVLRSPGRRYRGRERRVKARRAVSRSQASRSAARRSIDTTRTSARAVAQRRKST